MLLEKKKGFKRKLYHFEQLIKEFNYSGFGATTCEGFEGWYYVLTTNDTDTLEKLKKIDMYFHNTKTLVKNCEYAPELNYYCIFIANN